ncbi:uncharacterized protein LOC132032011 [Lycium ferocissimum]|uniref:uncharacterized protein LOC132032011 n=1 Tax=Lycium ferocissimum TaxID=112874 RepID=UPI0028151DBC|nr:uncharacterized protein LOC132032011 [Lycium ferocissimum]
MAKAYDKVSWLFLKAAIRKMGFSEVFIDIIHRLISNVWYSVMVNGSRYGFFHSTRVSRRPPSPGYLSYSLRLFLKANRLHNKEGYYGYTMHQKGPLINHLCYADDIVILNAATKIRGMIINILRQYEKEGQEINTNKKCF